jgi:hypothetical protein
MSLPQHSPEGQIGQVLLRLRYQELARQRRWCRVWPWWCRRHSGVSLPQLCDVEFRCYSQNGEDGILLYIFSLIGTSDRRVVEICAGDGIECNAANLIVNHGWQGLLFDGDAHQTALGQSFYASCRTTFVSPPRLVNAWITAANVNQLVAEQGFVGSIDLLSLDLDGNDYWIWSALECIKPNVVVLEFNAACGPERSMSMSYDPDYRADLTVQPYRFGASLRAFAKLARRKGYRLVGVQSMGFNAFFVRDGIGNALLPERSVEACYAANERLRGWTPADLNTVLSGAEKWEEV